MLYLVRWLGIDGRSHVSTMAWTDGGSHVISSTMAWTDGSDLGTGIYGWYLPYPPPPFPIPSGKALGCTTHNIGTPSPPPIRPPPPQLSSLFCWSPFTQPVEQGTEVRYWRTKFFWCPLSDHFGVGRGSVVDRSAVEVEAKKWVNPWGLTIDLNVEFY